MCQSFFYEKFSESSVRSRTDGWTSICTNELEIIRFIRNQRTSISCTGFYGEFGAQKLSLCASGIVLPLRPGRVWAHKKGRQTVIIACPFAFDDGRSTSRATSILMNILAAVEQWVAVARCRYPDFPAEWAAIFASIKHIDREISQGADALLQAWGITYAEYSMLLVLYGTEGGALSATSLGEVLSEASIHISRAGRQLCEKGLLVRGIDTTDRRNTLFTLSHAGKRLLDSLLPVLAGLLQHKTQAFASGEITELSRLLKQLMHKLS